MQIFKREEIDWKHKRIVESDRNQNGIQQSGNRGGGKGIGERLPIHSLQS